MPAEPEAVAELRLRARQAITSARSELRWKPGKAEAHLAKRIDRGHLPPSAPLADYEAVIRRVLSSSEARVYVFRFSETDYPTVVAQHQGKLWLVMLNADGVLETSFPPDAPEDYFRNEPRYIEIGRLEEVTK